MTSASDVSVSAPNGQLENPSAVSSFGGPVPQIKSVSEALETVSGEAHCPADAAAVQQRRQTGKVGGDTESVTFIPARGPAIHFCSLRDAGRFLRSVGIIDLSVI